MEAKDTVINHNERSGSGVYTRKEIEEQAEISFKAGQASANDVELIRDTYNRAYEKGKQAGIKEVVEWVGKRIDWKFALNSELGGHINIGTKEWQAKLTEWRVSGSPGNKP